MIYKNIGKCLTVEQETSFWKEMLKERKSSKLIFDSFSRGQVQSIHKYLIFKKCEILNICEYFENVLQKENEISFHLILRLFVIYFRNETFSLRFITKILGRIFFFFLTQIFPLITALESITFSSLLIILFFLSVFRHVTYAFYKVNPYSVKKISRSNPVAFTSFISKMSIVIAIH